MLAYRIANEFLVVQLVLIPQHKSSMRLPLFYGVKMTLLWRSSALLKALSSALTASTRSLTTHLTSFNMTFLKLLTKEYTNTLSLVIKFQLSIKGTFTQYKDRSSIFIKNEILWTFIISTRSPVFI